MKRRLPALSAFCRAACALLALLCALTLPTGAISRADEDAAAAVPTVGDCSDGALRAELRLCDLGYSARVPNGLWEQEDATALDRFAQTTGLSADAVLPALFSMDAPAAVNAQASPSPQNGALAAIGSAMPWEEVKPRLAVGQTYGVTGCRSGITLHLICVSADNHAHMQPALEWDEATLRGFFAGVGGSEKQPVAITIDGIRVAASIQLAPATSAGETAVFSVFFIGSVSDISGLPDAEHDRVVAAACGQG